MFDFVFELSKRLGGHSLLKELSHLGALRATEEDVFAAVRDKRLMQYYGYTAWQNGKAYSRLTFDPCNQIYAAWLVTIAGNRAKEIWGNNRERLGDMVECALALCWLVDEFP